MKLLSDKIMDELIDVVLKWTSILLMISLFALLFGCSNEVKLTSIEIEDPVRVYYPILQGSKQNIVVKFKNTGDEPLFIKDVLPSCGCTIARFNKSAIRPQEEGRLELEYNSNKNIGYVEIHTTILANTMQGEHSFVFKINVVPNALYTPDYEELFYNEMKEDKSLIQEMVDGKSSERGYLVEETESGVRKFN